MRQVLCVDTTAALFTYGARRRRVTIKVNKNKPESGEELNACLELATEYHHNCLLPFTVTQEFQSLKQSDYSFSLTLNVATHI